ncbi:DUF418 domain-containing protein [Arenimonas fontis]|uniref:DUF418 domain-containing protein n=1 Tax=Arenimonas fontis TaxID=2608255 RepID=A0A5B2ZCX9_9GAMM|nr:DUF418 domain-containing protein [Arenimonas fontis]KAA2285867.1 DUF418 domain-containing protein [Arenimonas fontis]
MGPVAAAERITVMDVLRGFALLGILLMNIEGMAGPLTASMTGVDPSLSGADRVADTLVYLLVQGKFYPLFSLLFGMGFAVMLARAQAREQPFFAIYLRRILALLAIGLVHALLIWAGDILVTYALAGFVLLLFFRRTPASRLIGWGVFWMLVPCVLNLLLGGLGSLVQLAPPEQAAEFQRQMQEQAATFAAQIEAQRLAYGSGSFAEATAQRVADVGSMLAFILIYGWFILGLFLLGAWFVRSGAIARPGEWPRLYAALRRLALPAGLAMTLWSWWLVPTMDFARLDLTASFAQVLQMLGGVLMALAYLAWIVRAVQAANPAGWPSWLAPAGRMALSNYLLQSLAMTLLFYHYGLGLFEQVPRAWQLPLATGFFLLQLGLSRWWLDRFRMGPVEWLWRAATYGSLPPMRR